MTDKRVKLSETEKAARWFAAISECSLPGVGITRPSYSDEETAAMRVVAHWALGIGLEVTWDFAGNLHCYLPGVGKEIALGSHVDSVPNGGQYDGVAGVVAAMCVIDRVLASPPLRQPAPPLRLIVYRGEESAWFGKCYLGSLALFGKLPAHLLVDLRHRMTGQPLAVAMARVGAMVDRVIFGERVLDPAPIARFYEVHIEQGPWLVEQNQPVGIVSGIRGNHRYLQAVAHGEAGHSGTVPMVMRDDAVANFTRFYFELLASRAVYQEQVVLTCGVLSTDPNKHAVSIIPDEVRFALEYRAHDPAALEAFARLVHKRASARQIELGAAQETAPVLLDAQVAEELRIHAERVTQAAVPVMPSGAGHDAAVFQQEGIPTGMIFIRNAHGSHNPAEAMALEDFLVAVDVLHRAVTC